MQLKFVVGVQRKKETFKTSSFFLLNKNLYTLAWNGRIIEMEKNVS